MDRELTLRSTLGRVLKKLTGEIPTEIKEIHSIPETSSQTPQRRRPDVDLPPTRPLTASAVRRQDAKPTGQSGDASWLAKCASKDVGSHKSLDIATKATTVSGVPPISSAQKRSDPAPAPSIAAPTSAALANRPKTSGREPMVPVSARQGGSDGQQQSRAPITTGAVPESNSQSKVKPKVNTNNSADANSEEALKHRRMKLLNDTWGNVFVVPVRQQNQALLSYSIRLITFCFAGQWQKEASSQEEEAKT